MTTSKIFATAAVLAGLAFPSAAVADKPTSDTTPSASSQCKSLRTSMGAKAFGEAYGTNANRANAFGKCVSKLNKAQDAAEPKAKSDCKAEQDADEAAFKAKFGTNKKGANAFGKCVSGKEKKAADKAKAAELNAAKQCKAERSQDEKAFTAKFATNAKKSNAFGKCVSAKAKAKPAPAPAPAA